MPHKDPEVRRARDRERFARRTAERRAAGLCPKCGRRPPEPGRSLCGSCAEKARAAGRARDARLRAAGERRRDPEKARAYERERARRQAADRAARGLCTKCGRNPAEPGRRLCGPCAAKRGEADRRRYANAKAAGKKYGGKNVESKRRSARVASRKRREACRKTGLCPRCGRRPPAGAAPPASRAGRPGRPPSASDTRRGGPPACAPAAGGRRPTGTPAARPAARWKPSAAGPSARTPAAGNGIGNGAPPADARTATGRALEHRAVRIARSVLTSAPTSSAASRYGIRASP